MFERYTEKARRVIFFARYEASQFGSPYIETEHLLLGLLREDKALTNRFLRSHATVESIRKQIEQHTVAREKILTSVDLPLSDDCRYVLAYAAEEAERLSQKHIGTEHLLLGLLREEKCFAAELLTERGVRLPAIREELQRAPHEEAPRQRPNRKSSLPAEFSRDLTEAAMNNLLEPLVGRDNVIQELLEVLCSHANRNPLLICAPGVAGNSIVELLAQMIADDEVPTFLQNKQLLALDLGQMLEMDSKLSNDRLTMVVKELIENQDCIVFIDEIHRLAELDPFGKFRRALLNGEIQCIGASTPADYERAVRNMPWLGRCFRNVRVGPMLEDDVIRSLHARKHILEKFHAVTYADEAIELAVRYSARYFSSEALFERAMDALDVAGTRVKLRQATLPEELIEVQKRIKFIVHRMEVAIANHEFEKARFYTDEERKERENLRALSDNYHLDEPSAGIVGGGDIADVVSRWTGYPVDTIKEGTAIDEEDAGTVHRKSPRLRVFMCHASKDKLAVHGLYSQLKKAEIEPWLDAEDLIGGQEWRSEIEKAVRSSHIVLVCLSKQSVSSAGFVHKEIRIALDVADLQPEGTIFVIPLKLEECEVPDRLKQWQWVDLYKEKGFDRLMRALTERGRSIGIELN